MPLENRTRVVTCGSSGYQGGARIFVDQAAQDGFPEDRSAVEVGNGEAATAVLTVGDALGDALMRPGRVVVHLVSSQDGAQMALPEDQHAVQELPAQGADEALADRVHPRSLENSAGDTPNRVIERHRFGQQLTGISVDSLPAAWQLAS